MQVESLNQQLAYLKGYHVEELEMFKKENKSEIKSHKVEAEFRGFQTTLNAKQVDAAAP